MKFYPSKHVFNCQEKGIQGSKKRVVFDSRSLNSALAAMLKKKGGGGSGENSKLT